MVISRVMFAGAVALAFAQAAFAADTRSPAEDASDRAAIEALMWRYVRALDSLDPAAYASVFTEDGTFGSGSQQRKGRADLQQMVADLKKGRADREAAGQKNPAMYHVITNDSIEFVGPNEARYYSYWMTVFGALGTETPTRVAAAGQGLDQLVRVNGQWLIKNRNVAPQ